MIIIVIIIFAAALSIPIIAGTIYIACKIYDGKKMRIRRHYVPIE